MIDLQGFHNTIKEVNLAAHAAKIEALEDRLNVAQTAGAKQGKEKEKQKAKMRVETTHDTTLLRCEN